MEFAGFFKRIAILIVHCLLIAFVVSAFGGCARTSKTNPSTPQGSSPTDEGKPEVSPAAGTVRVYFLKGEELVEVERNAEGADPLKAAISSLLDGPTSSEKREGISTAIPEGVRLLSSSVESGVARLDFSGEMKKYGGGSAWVIAIENQIKKTVTANSKGINNIEIYIEGVPSEESLQP